MKAIFFDVDNTLINRTAAADRKFRALLKEFRKDLDPASLEFENIIQQALDWDEGGNSPKEYVFSNFLRTCGLSEDPIPELILDWQKTFGNYTVVFEESKKVLETLRERGYRLGIVTNGSALMQKRKLELSGLQDWFETVVISGMTSFRKPDPRIFEMAADQMGVKCSDCVFVGDTFYTDIVGAIRAGMEPIWLFSDHLRKSEYPVLVARTIDEIPALVEKIEKKQEEVNRPVAG